MSSFARTVVVGLGSLLIAGSAWAIKEPETGVSFPDNTKCAGAPAKAAAVGVREATFGIDVYGAVLYVTDKAAGKSLRGTEECMKIRTRFVRDVEAEKIRGAWVDGFKKQGLSTSDPGAAKLLGVIKQEMKKGKEMAMEVFGAKVVFRYMAQTVTISGAKKLAQAIKGIYLGSSSPIPSLVKDLGKRGLARP